MSEGGLPEEAVEPIKPTFSKDVMKYLVEGTGINLDGLDRKGFSVIINAASDRLTPFLGRDGVIALRVMAAAAAVGADNPETGKKLVGHTSIKPERIDQQEARSIIQIASGNLSRGPLGPLTRDIKVIIGVTLAGSTDNANMNYLLSPTSLDVSKLNTSSYDHVTNEATGKLVRTPLGQYGVGDLRVMLGTAVIASRKP